MTLGTIKAEALRLMHVEENIDEMNVEDLLNDESFSVLYTGTVGAINRAFADLESKRTLPLCRMSLPMPQMLGGMARFDLSLSGAVFEPVRLVAYTNEYYDDDHPYRYEAGQVLINDYDAAASYELLYLPAITRITPTTDNDNVLTLVNGTPWPEVLAAALPYYIKADLFRIDEPGEANDARNWYEMAVAQYADGRQQGVQGSVIDAFKGAF